MWRSSPVTTTRPTSTATSGSWRAAARPRGWPRSSRPSKPPPTSWTHDRGMSTDDTTPAPTVWACLSYDDAPAALRLLVDVFGFEERLVVRDTDGREVRHAELVWPFGGGVMLGSRDA